jgi:hypothetical protein
VYVKQQQTVSSKAEESRKNSQDFHNELSVSFCVKIDEPDVKEHEQSHHDSEIRRKEIFIFHFLFLQNFINFLSERKLQFFQQKITSRFQTQDPKIQIRTRGFRQN